MQILIQNTQLINEGSIQKTDVLIENGIFKTISPNIAKDTIDVDCTIVNGAGKYLIPGLIDDQVHFREPGLTHKANIETESKAAIAGGITSFIEMPNTIPQATTIELLEDKFTIAANTSFANYSFMFGGTNDNLEEVLKVDKNAVAGLKLFLGSSTGNMLVDNPDTLRSIFKSTDLVISVHCEDETTIRKNMAAHVAEYGDNIPIHLHPIIRSEEACYLSSSKAIELAKETGARLHVFHLSTAKELELFDNSIPLKDKQITAEVCIHHLWFSDADYHTKGTHIKWNPAVKTAHDRDGLLAGLLADKIDVIATDHAPHTLEEKDNVYSKAPSGGPLVQHALVALLEMYHQGKISLEKIVEKACHNPAILFQVEKRGYIKEGFFADAVLFDLNDTWTVKKDNILYKCGWSPFEGSTFKAKISHTFLNGNIAYQNGKVNEETRFGKRLTFDR